MQHLQASGAGTARGPGEPELVGLQAGPFPDRWRRLGDAVERAEVCADAGSGPGLSTAGNHDGLVAGRAESL